jgi:hypothetical protein
VPSRIVIVVNKWWEADPFCGALVNDRARPPTLTNIRASNYPATRLPRPPAGAPRPADPPVVPRLACQLADATVEVWCLEELMNPAENSSSSAEKARVLGPALASGPAPDLVVAIGTAGSPSHVRSNGSVVIGSQTFVHDPKAGVADRTGLWTPPQPDQVVVSPFPARKLVQADEQARYAAEARFLKPPIDPAATPLIVAGTGLISVSVVNITNYDDYVWADREAIDTFRAHSTSGQVGSVETTHGVIRAASNAPFLFVSGLTDTEGLFDYQVTARVYAQNFVAAHNAAIALLWLLPSLAR